MHVITYLREFDGGFQVKTDYLDGKGIIRKVLRSPMFSNRFKAENFLQKVNGRS